KEKRKPSKRLEDALAGTPENPPKAPEPEPNEQVELETTLTFSERERLQKADFESMSAEEFALARRLAERLPLPIPPLATRRFEA
ncbi:VWA domain-containing protein, partial [Pseudomonas aeruginosa]|nr:VWA domain-containing protein [Pseudomonas aeruginosa]